jgi:hypothetical protein
MNDNRYGEVPVGSIFFAACDAKYFKKFAPAFVSSIGSNSSRNIHIHVINPDEEVFALACYLNSRVSQHVTYTFEDSDLSMYSDEQKRALYASLRFLVAPYILSHADQLMILDIDCMVMKSFDFPAMPVGYFPREPLPGTVGWEQEGTKCAAGCVFLDRSAMNVANAISETLGGLELKWFNDQIALNHVMNQMPKTFVHEFDNEFMDWEFKEGTAIWTGKGARKYDNETYVSKQHEYHDKIMNNNYDKVILAPRLDIPFKQFDIVRAQSVNEPVREYWKRFIDSKVINGYFKISSPRWMFNSKIEKYFPELKEILVPHVEQHNWKGGDKAYFYMQTVFPWLFTVDPLGWAGGASYIDSFDPEAEYDSTAFKTMQNRLGKGKFGHLQSNDTPWNLIADDYIIVPLQLPHDETIKYHSDFSVEHFVRQLCHMANLWDGPQLVFKGHPVNLASMEPLKKIIESGFYNVIYIANGNFNELVEKSQAMFVLNGGSGQEAMLHEKAVVCFGRCDYAPAVIQGDISNPEQAWKDVQNDNWFARLAMYKRWYDWYINKICIDTGK